MGHPDDQSPSDSGLRGNDRDPGSEELSMRRNDDLAHRRLIRDAWHKSQGGKPLTALEAQIVAVIRQHPECHALLESPGMDLAVDPSSGMNPFLHLSLHLAILEQLSIDQPPGIRALYQELLGHLGDPHQVEHRIMDCLAELLWRAQRHGAPLDNVVYLDCIRRLRK